MSEAETFRAGYDSVLFGWQDAYYLGEYVQAWEAGRNQAIKEGGSLTMREVAREAGA